MNLNIKDMDLSEVNFTNIFASGAKIGEVLDWDKEEYLAGWGYLGKYVAPPMEYFNALQSMSDVKDYYLYVKKADKDELPTELKCPYSLRISIGSQNVSYDGSEKKVFEVSLASKVEIEDIVQ